MWREALLARAVLRGETRGYRHHPQLERFASCAAPRAAINTYLAGVLAEAERRGYAFDRTKVGRARGHPRIACTEGQLRHEWRHLMRKLKSRNPRAHRRWRGLKQPDPHPLFRVRAGTREPWERARARRLCAR